MKKLWIAMLAVSFCAIAMAQNNISLPAGTSVRVRLENALSTASNKSGDTFSGRITEAVLQDGKMVIPIGATVQGRVTQVSEPRRIAGKPTISMFPETLIMPNGDRFMLNATLVDTSLRHDGSVNDEGQYKGKGHNGTDVTQIAMGTGGGMLIGGLIAGAKGMLIGGAVGVTATVAHWLGKRNSATLPAGTELVMELSHPLEMAPEVAVAVPASGGQ
jgi:hypothetical protein